MGRPKKTDLSNKEKQFIDIYLMNGNDRIAAYHEIWGDKQKKTTATRNASTIINSEFGQAYIAKREQEMFELRVNAYERTCNKLWRWSETLERDCDKLNALKEFAKIMGFEQTILKTEGSVQVTFVGEDDISD